MHRFRLTLSPLLAGIPLLIHGADVNWDTYLGDKLSSQYSTLDQISTLNVHLLEEAWVFHSGGADTNNNSQIQCNPLIVDGVLFGTSPRMQLFALDATSGTLLWRFDPFAEGGRPMGMGVNRGLVFWADGFDRRILYGANNHLHAIDADSGRPVSGFGQNGRVDLRDGLGRDASHLALAANTPGIVYGNLLILGMRVSEGPGPTAPGHIRAYDIRTGGLVWRFNTIPHPGEYGYETWPRDAYLHIGGANVWTGFALDEKR